jgi:hypothetical protein
VGPARVGGSQDGQPLSAWTSGRPCWPAVQDRYAGPPRNGCRTRVVCPDEPRSVRGRSRALALLPPACHKGY